MKTTGLGFTDRMLSETEVRDIARQTFAECPVDGKRVVVVIPDGTRSGPVGLFFKVFYELLNDRVSALDYLVALGTHQPMSTEALCKRVSITPEELDTRYAGTQVFNHEWSKTETFREIGKITPEEVSSLSNGLLSVGTSVAINKLIFDYDLVVICGPVFPHEVVGYSGGNKYFFPGISGKQLIDLSHWLGALITCRETIGVKHTPMRALIDRAASYIDMPKLCFCMVVKGDGLAGLYTGTPEDAWSAAADLSSQVHVKWESKPYRQVLSVMPDLYDDIWTAAKGMYKLEPVVEDGGELIIYAPKITEISYSHGDYLDEIGYHVRDYFVKQWDRFKDVPWGVLAHSTHLRGAGTFENGVEKPRIRVTLATGIPRERCEQVNIGYLDPATINPDTWQAGEPTRLLVPHAGEMLYRLS